MSNEKKSHLANHYPRFLQHLKNVFNTPSTLTLQEKFQQAQEQMVGLNELTREEAEHLSDYLYRDLQDAAVFLVESQQALADWLQFDLELVEDQLLNLFSGMVDHTRQEIENLAERARQANEWSSGEVTGPGTLFCAHCEHRLQFTQPDYIPVCPNCGTTLFLRQLPETEV